ncbi:MAG: hypothetical protein RIR53_1558, partial [Bacteroidota bacterium]
VGFGGDLKPRRINDSQTITLAKMVRFRLAPYRNSAVDREKENAVAITMISMSRCGCVPNPSPAATMSSLRTRSAPKFIRDGSWY